MKRLTKKVDGAWTAICEYGNLPCPVVTQDVIDRLAAYEDTGLEPEEIQAIAGLASENCAKTVDAIDKLLQDDAELKSYHELGSIDRLRELAQADREGRCGIPPVKTHQKVFRVFNGEIYEEIVCNAIWEPLMPRPRWKVFVMGGGMPYFWHEVFGKTVFLSRAEAEAALRREQDE